MKIFDINEDPHRRYNPLINEWVLVSPRSKRPWQGQNKTIHSDALPEYDTTCYLCREMFVNGMVNLDYKKFCFLKMILPL
jgi:UDPglucose--hexose-1-phosphate uridylyltransferase